VRRIVFVLASVAVIGCGGGPVTEPVEGRVTLDGQPLTAGTVTFTPQGGRSATGFIQSDGTFSLSTFADGDGALPGLHKVSIAGGGTGTPQRPDFDSDAVKAAAAASPIPAIYANPDSSGLTFEVKTGEANSPEFKLESGTR
jgi:hypothetical protein